MPCGSVFSNIEKDDVHKEPFSDFRELACTFLNAKMGIWLLKLKKLIHCFKYGDSITHNNNTLSGAHS